jgi:hypothetical protein
MNFTKWLRKNNMKIMAVVIVVLMIGFVAGTYIRQLSNKRFGGESVVATYRGDKEITNKQLTNAAQELELLGKIGADTLLNSISLPFMQQSKDLRTVLLGVSLFPERASNQMVAQAIKQMIAQNNYVITDEQVDAIFQPQTTPSVIWYLLNQQALEAGFHVSNENAKKQLAAILPQLNRQFTYGQVMSGLMQQGMSEAQVLNSFGKLLAVWQYVNTMTTSNTMTQNQLMAETAIRGDVMSLEFVRLNAAQFIADIKDATKKQLGNQFNAYKSFYEGKVTEDNPYGFGYKQPARLSMEYIALKMDDIAKTVDPVTEDQSESFYRSNVDRFVTQVPTDTNDPNSPLVEKTLKYAQVAHFIKKDIRRRSVIKKAELIIADARKMSEQKLEESLKDTSKMTSDQFKELAADYRMVADNIAEKYKVNVYTNTAGPLSVIEMQSDANMANLKVDVQGYSPMVLSRYLFSVNELGTSKLGPFDIPAPRIYENISPIKDRPTELNQGLGNIIMLARIIRTKPDFVPQNLNVTIARIPLKMSNEKAPDNILWIREKVMADVKKKQAMDNLDGIITDLKKSVAANGWEDALEQFNKKYAKKDANEAPLFSLETNNQIARISPAILETIEAQSVGKPTGQFAMNVIEKRLMLHDKLFSLIPNRQEDIQNLPLSLRLNAEQAYLLIKDMKVERVKLEEFQQTKAINVFSNSIMQSQTNSPIFMNPDNIIELTGYKEKPREDQEDEKADANQSDVNDVNTDNSDA